MLGREENLHRLPMPKFVIAAEWVREPDGYCNRSGKEVCSKMLKFKNLAGLKMFGEADFVPRRQLTSYTGSD